MKITEMIADSQQRAFLSGRKPMFLLAGTKEIDAIYESVRPISDCTKSEFRMIWTCGDMEFWGMITGMMVAPGIAIVTVDKDDM